MESYGSPQPTRAAARGGMQPSAMDSAYQLGANLNRDAGLALLPGSTPEGSSAIGSL